MIRSAPLDWGRGSAGSLAVLLGVLWAPGGFTSAEPVPAEGPTPVELTVVGGPELNPNAQGRASPVLVRIFDLAAARTFESADFEALFERPGDVLKHDLVAQEEFVLRPGDIQQRDRSLQPPVQVLGVAAGFRDLEHAVWRLTVPIKRGHRNFLLIDLDRDRIRLVTVDPGQPQ
jgi:type VI secretion system protein VasD